MEHEPDHRDHAPIPPAKEMLLTSRNRVDLRCLNGVYTPSYRMCEKLERSLSSGGSRSLPMLTPRRFKKRTWTFTARSKRSSSPKSTDDNSND